MPVAYSNKTIIFSGIASNPVTSLLSDLHTVLINAGWIVTTTLTGGHIYEITSPQTVDYKAHVLIQDNVNYKIDHPLADLFNFTSAVIQVLNVAEDKVSFPYQLNASFDAYTAFQVVAGRCQLFISVPGHIGGGWSSFACGIPYVPPLPGGACTVESPTVTTDIWWACAGGQFIWDFRSQANALTTMTYYLNGTVFIAQPGTSWQEWDGLLCLFPLTAVNTYAVAQIPWPTITYSSHNVLAIDAFVGWQWQIRGQLWDAYLQTAAGALDAIVTATDVDLHGQTFTVRSITWHSQFYSSLQLIYEIGRGGFGNVAY